MDQHLGVGMGGEPVATRNQVLTYFLEIIDLAIEHNPDRSVFIADWLVPGIEIDNRKPAHTECDLPAKIETVIVRTAMRDLCGHRPRGFLIGFFRSIKIYDSDNSAH